MYPEYFFAEVDSTNAIAKKLADEGEVHGTTVRAEYQSAGRGRLGKTWCSIKGSGLYFSIIVRPRIAPENYAKITLASGLGVALVIESILKKSVGLKWPNDIFLGQKKCCGILTESSPVTNGKFSYAIVGIGINLNQCCEDFPPELRKTATSVFIESHQIIDHVEILRKVRAAILKQIKRLEEDKFPEILADWKTRDFLYGRQMVCVGGDGKIIRGRSLGPDANGILHLEDNGGVVREVLSGDIRLAEQS